MDYAAEQEWLGPAKPSLVLAWAERFGRTEAEGWRRLGYRVAARCLGSDPLLRANVVAFGSTAMWMAYRAVRTPYDFDLLARRPLLQLNSPDALSGRLKAALAAGMPRFCPEYGRYGKVLEEVLKFRLSTEWGQWETTPIAVGPDETLDFMPFTESVAHKFVALGREPDPLADPRSTPRGKHVFDLCHLLRTAGYGFDHQAIGELARAAIRHDGHMIEFGPRRRDELARDYSRLRELVGRHFIPFGQAWSETSDAVRRMKLA